MKTIIRGGIFIKKSCKNRFGNGKVTAHLYMGLKIRHKITSMQLTKNYKSIYKEY